MYKDHNNLIFIFNPLSLLQDLNLSSLKNVLRCAVILSWFDYVCHHISGIENVWADLLGRWSVPRLLLRRILTIPPLVSVSNADFIWPDKAEVMQIQDRHKHLVHSKCNRHSHLWRNSEGAVWVSDEAEGL